MHPSFVMLLSCVLLHLLQHHITAWILLPGQARPFDFTLFSYLLVISCGSNGGLYSASSSSNSKARMRRMCCESFFPRLVGHSQLHQHALVVEVLVEEAAEEGAEVTNLLLPFGCYASAHYIRSLLSSSSICPFRSSTLLFLRCQCLFKDICHTCSSKRH